jgi:ABC-type multidrug transport system fused ATPase/permease subunit
LDSIDATCFMSSTGAGKSSLVAALYRLVELSSAAIMIYGVDIITIGLRHLTNAISIIPQDPAICVIYVQVQYVADHIM